MLELFFYSCNVFILSSLLLLEENLNLYMLENVRQFFLLATSFRKRYLFFEANFK